MKFGMETGHKHSYRLCMKHCSPRNNYKHLDGAKRRSSARQINVQRICYNNSSSNDDDDDDDDDENIIICIYSVILFSLDYSVV